MTTPRIDVHGAAPDVHAAMADLDALASGPLDPLLAELVRIRASQINGCTLCLSIHTRVALTAGERQERLQSVAAWRTSPLFTDAERAALELAEAMTLITDAGVPDEVFAAAREHFDETRLTHLLWTIAAINAWNRVGIAASAPA
ncbi:carboxymuconolactone decarboxylase family protein [Actinomadura violacea]|uniref:Carboxymuconolactone decarboxylase family protein n=1 Tax=Actinomadura violacea TaxID=2819934 RepID=A0ABS3S9B9_9ACTN|nr:carboxymuconolactone decarboxylase family protein [Actinomadura violacea]MBO2465602.1 carboxymuconolactone decarboxylase family protein [Actinomadura violacea]